MTENKRFTVPIKYQFSHSKIQLNGEPLTNDELIRILNTNDGAFFENFAIKQENEQLKKALWEAEKSYIYETNDNSIDIEKDMEHLKKEFEKEYWKHD